MRNLMTQEEKERAYNFTNGLIELSAGLEFTFLDFNLHEVGNKSTPYIATGVTFSNFDNYYFNDSGERISENTTSNGYGIPMIIGFKTTLTDSLIFAIENWCSLYLY